MHTQADMLILSYLHAKCHGVLLLKFLLAPVKHSDAFTNDWFDLRAYLSAQDDHSCKVDKSFCCAQALKILLATVKHFDDFMEDQFDFHAYCVRKMTLRAYVQMLRMEDTIHKNIFYSKVWPPKSPPIL